MIRVYGLLLVLLVYGANLTLAPALEVAGVRPNLLLMLVILLGVQWVHPGFFVLAAVLGLAQDSYSHGVLGMYGLTFVATALLANVIGRVIYEHNLLFSVGTVFGLSLVHGTLALSLLSAVFEGTAWGAWFATRVAPQALYHALLTPLALLAMRRLMRFIPPYSLPV